MRYLLILLLIFSCCIFQGCAPSTDSAQSNTDGTESAEKSNTQTQTLPDTHEILIGEVCDHVDELYMVVKKIGNEASAESFVNEITAFQDQGQSLTDRLEALPDAPEDEAKRLQEKYGDKLAELTRQIEEIRNTGRKFPALNKALRGAMPIF